MNKQYIAIPLGDPAGIGPEIVVKALQQQELQQAANLVVIGERQVVEQALGFSGIELEIREINLPQEGDYGPGRLNLIDLANVDMEALELGKVSGMCGRAAYEYIEKSIQLANQGLVDCVSTPPINKESLKAGGVDFIGHTEIFGALTGTQDPLTMFEVRGMRVFFLTRHVSLRQACDLVKRERIVDYVQRCTEALHRLGVTQGTMAVAGLNPHSGEHGLFGNEEEEVVLAVEQLQGLGYAVEGPVPADSVFHLALKGRYNSVLSLYHDQGHIATKTLDFERTIAITGGLPFLRTAVDHGTAMDIAGRGIASAVSMIEALQLAIQYAPSFRKTIVHPKV